LERLDYIATGLKDPGQIRVGDTITNPGMFEDKSFQALAGYKEPRPMVFASFFPENSEEYDLLKDALSKLKANRCSLLYEPSHLLVLAGFPGRISLACSM